MTLHQVAVEAFRNAEFVSASAVGSYLATSRKLRGTLSAVRETVALALQPIHARLTRLEQVMRIPPRIAEVSP